MNAFNKRVPFLLFLGDIIILYVSLWITLVIRYQQIPDQGVFSDHTLPFSLLFIVWILVFYIAGLYEKQVIIIKNRLPITILKAQFTNSIIAVLFFYFIPYFGITPKTNLFIYLIVSLLLIVIWRIWGYNVVGSKHKQHAILIASGHEMKELFREVNANDRYNLNFISSVDLDAEGPRDFKKEIIEQIRQHDISVIVIDFKHEKAEPMLPSLYNLIFSNIVFIDMHNVYEDVFDRIPLSLITYSWFLENISLAPKLTYDLLKRIMDVVIALPAALIVSLIVYPLVWIAMLFDEGKGLFSIQERVGEDNKPIRLLKFRTMKIANDGGKWEQSENRVTRFGEFLRKTRIDELPQFWNVVFGDVSLIGPRPEFFAAVKKYEQEIPYYSIRHLIKPGLSGWAQIYGDHPHHGVDFDKTKNKLSYDLFYLKNRSFLLDVTIALKTIKKLLSRSGV